MSSFDSGDIAGETDLAPSGSLDLVAKLGQRSVRDAVRQLRTVGRVGAPLVVDLDPTSFCDLACPSCISAPLLGQGRFTKQRLLALGSELAQAGVRAVILIGGGEPLMHPATVDTAGILSSQGVNVGLVTNGTQLHHRTGSLAEFLTWARVSVDAATASTYEEMRPRRAGGSAFDKVIDNIGALAARGGAAVGYSFVVTDGAQGSGKQNVSEISAAARLASSLGCRYVEFKAEMDLEHNVQGWPDHVVMEVRQQLGLAKAFGVPGVFDILVSSNLSAALMRTRDQLKSYHECSVAELRTTITPTGVYVCAYHRGNERFRLGDAVTTSFEEIWRSADTRIVSPVRDCPFHCARHTLNEAVETTDLNGPVVDDHDLFI